MNPGKQNEVVQVNPYCFFIICKDMGPREIRAGALILALVPLPISHLTSLDLRFLFYKMSKRGQIPH